MSYIRLYLVPVGDVQQVIDVPADVLVLSEGQFTPPQVASSISLRDLPVGKEFTPFNSTDPEFIAVQSTKEVRVCYREPEGVQDYPDDQVIEATDPSGGQCICGVTCAGTDLRYVKVHNVPVTV